MSGDDLNHTYRFFCSNPDDKSKTLIHQTIFVSLHRFYDPGVCPGTTAAFYPFRKYFMRTYIFGSLFLVFFTMLSGQQTTTFLHTLEVGNRAIVTDSVYIDPKIFDDNMVSIAVTVQKEEWPLELVLDLSTSKGRRNINPGCEVNVEDFLFVSKLEILEIEESGWLYFFYKEDGLSIRRINITYHVHQTPLGKPSVMDVQSGRRTDCTCPEPSYIPRSSWGSAYQLTNDIYVPPATLTDVTHLIVHHSASSNQSDNWPAVVASFFVYHTMTNGWQDIGYNWLIDPLGNIYQGRGGGQDVRGAHMCGYNNNTMGICVIGTYSNVDPTPAAIQSLEKLLSYKACQKEFGTEESAPIVSHTGFMFRVSGHRDGCAPGYTECPGNRLHAFLPVLRTNCTEYMVDSCMLVSGQEVVSDDPLMVFYANGMITVDSEKEVIVNVTNISGQRIRSFLVRPGRTQYMLNEPPGLYFILINDGNQKVVRKIGHF